MSVGEWVGGWVIKLFFLCAYSETTKCIKLNLGMHMQFGRTITPVYFCLNKSIVNQ